MQVGFLMALAGVPVRELFVYVGYWQKTRAPLACQRAESIKTSRTNTEGTSSIFRTDVVQVDSPNHISN
jgi:hypothetical protein